MALWRRRHTAPADVPVDPSRPVDRMSTRQKIELIQKWGERLSAAVERVEKVAPLLLPDEKKSGREGHA